MMTDFNIRRGLSTQLFSEPGVLNSKVLIEEGCWYLCTDTAELYLGVQTDSVLTLKKINGIDPADIPTQDPSQGEGDTPVGIIGAHIEEETGELYILFSDGTEESLGVVVGEPGKDGLVTAVKIGDTTFEHTDGIIKLPDFITADEVDEKLTGFIKEIPDEYITESELEAKGFITDISGKAEVKHTHSIADIEDYTAPDLSDYAKSEDIPDVSGFATKTELNEAIKGIEHPSTDLTNYVTKDEISDYLKEIPGEYVTETELDAKGYLTEHQSLAGYATENYVTTSLTADKILFTEAKFVTKAIGKFTINENLQGQTIAQLFAKLLELSDTPNENPDEPDTPIEPDDTTIVEQIIDDKIPMYHLTDDGVLTALSYEDIITITAEEDALQQQPKPTQSGFYKILDADGKVTEYGYQQVQVRIPGVPFMIALPSFIDYTSQITPEMYRELDSSWQPTNLVLVNDLEEIAEICDLEGCEVPEIPEGYTLWVSKDADVMSSNTIYRFIIKEDA